MKTSSHMMLRFPLRAVAVLVFSAAAFAPSAGAYEIRLRLQSLQLGDGNVVQINADQINGAFSSMADTGLVTGSSGITAQASASGSLATGEMRIFTEASGGINLASATIELIDTLMFALPPGMTDAAIGFAVNVSGFTAAPNPGGNSLLKAAIGLQSGGLFNVSFSETFAGGGSAPPALIDSRIFGEVVVQDGTAVRVTPSLTGFLSNGLFDLSSTASVEVILPQGVSFTSESGVFLSQAGPSQIPEPGTFVLGLGGLAALLLFERRRGTGRRDGNS